MKVYAFDVDETLECSNGPVSLQSLRQLKEEGHIVGLCGNLHCFMERVSRWQDYISFTLNFDTMMTLGGLLPKEYWLKTFTVSCRRGTVEEYIFVGNELGVTGASDDKGAAERASGNGWPDWRFIREDAFAAGAR